MGRIPIVFVTLIALITLTACRETGLRTSEQVSPGGVPYTLVQMPDVADVAIQIAWGTDWATRDEVNQTAPYVGAQLILAGGAEGYAPGEAGELFADLNAEAYLNSTIDAIYGTLIAERGSLDQVMPVARAHLQDPALDPMWFERIRENIRQNVAEEQGDPAMVGFGAMRWSVFGTAPVRRALSLDDPAEWQSLTVDDVAQWRNETLTRAPKALVVAGDIDADTAGLAIDQLMQGLPDGKNVSDKGFSVDFTPKRILLHMPDAKITHLGFVAALPPTRDGGEFEDVLLIQALGQGDQSALFEAVRTDLRATYNFGAGIGNFTRDDRILVMEGAVDPDKLAEAETAVREAYAAFVAGGAIRDPAEQTRPLASNLENLPNLPARMAYSVLESQLDGYPTDRVLGMLSELEAVSKESLKVRLETAYPAADQFIVVAVSADDTALPGACVITKPADAMDCP